VDELNVAMSKGQGRNQIDPLLNALAEYATDHFGYEEGCMDKYQCPVAVRNKQAHEKFIETINGIREDYHHHGITAEMVLKINDYLGGWLVKHIRGIDSELGACIHKVKQPSTKDKGA
jgi:hemerythrin-like metal-binding protein